MKANLTRLKNSSDDLHGRFDQVVKDFTKPPGALAAFLRDSFQAELWTLYVQQAEAVCLIDRKLSNFDIEISHEVQALVDDVRHGIFLSFRRLSGMNSVRENGPCPMCLETCSKTNPRATSHVIADAAYRALISQFDSSMANSMMFFDQGVHVPGKSGPSSIKWKMLCRNCEDFMVKAGEKDFTEVLKLVLTGVNSARILHDTAWRYTFAATLLWRSMHVCQPFESRADVSAMYRLYDELNAGMQTARLSIKSKERINAQYPSVTIYISAVNHRGNNSGATQGFYYAAAPDTSNGYANVQIGTFHFFGFFNSDSKEKLYPDVVEDTGPNWNIPEGSQRNAPPLVKYEESLMIEKNIALRADASDKSVADFFVRCKLRKNADGMTEFTDQNLLRIDGDVPVATVFLSVGATLTYYPTIKIVRYVERFLGIDKIYGNGFDLIYVVTDEGDIDTADVSRSAFICSSVDPSGSIQFFCQRENEALSAAASDKEQSFVKLTFDMDLCSL